MFTSKQLNNAVQYAMEEEIDYIKHLSSELGKCNIVMIGAGPGILGMAATEDNHEAFLTIVDIDDSTLNYSRIHLTAAGVPVKNLEFILSDSYEAGLKYGGEPIDLLIVDGDHSSLGVQRDIEAWWPNLAVNGYMFFHDYFERKGGFRGSENWVGGGVYDAIVRYRGSHWWKLQHVVGISAVVRPGPL